MFQHTTIDTFCDLVGGIEVAEIAEIEVIGTDTACA